MRGRKPRDFQTADIDWLAVDMVAREGKRLPLTAEERMAVVRQVGNRLLAKFEATTTIPAGKVTAAALAQRFLTPEGPVSERTVQRIIADLPPATQRRCPVCHQPMWVLLDGTVEQHGNRIYERCDMSGREVLRGLAAERPDLYQWVVAS